MSEAARALPPLVHGVASGSYPVTWERRSSGRDFIVIAPIDLGQRKMRVVVRPYRRGGIVQRVTTGTYLGTLPRSFQELRCLVELSRRGVAVVPPVGAAAYWRMPWLYQAWLVTEYVEGSVTFWQWLQGKPGGEERSRVLDATARVIARFHRAGAKHPDLNVHNVLVQWQTGTACVWLVDLDRVSLQPQPTMPQSSLARLWRSASKLDHERQFWTVTDQHLLERAVERYWAQE